MTECYECAKLAELMAENNALRGIVDDLKVPTDPGEASMMSVDAFIKKQAEHESHDNREKLEADMKERLGELWANAWNAGSRDSMDDDFDIDVFSSLLDRQAAITERHWMEIVGASANANVELKRQIDERQAKVNELTEQLESAHAKNRSLKAHIAKMQEGRHGWHVKGVELEKENAELRAAYDELTAIASQLCRACGFTMVDASGEVLE